MSKEKKRFMRGTMKLLCSVLISALLAPPLFAQEEEEEVVTELSLSDLLNMEITVASGKAERTSDAAGAVTAYSKEDIKRFVKVRLAAHEYPREIEFVDELPMTTTGKIMRRELKKLEIERKAKAP